MDLIPRRQNSNWNAGRGVGNLLDAAFPKAIELLPRLAVEVLAVHDEDAFVDGVAFLRQGGGFEGGERHAATRGVPDEAVAVVGFEVVLAPVLDVDECVVQGGPVVAGEGVALEEGAGCGKDIRSDYFAQQAGELAIRQRDAVQGLELLAQITLMSSTVAYVRTVGALQVFQLVDETLLDALLSQVCKGRVTVELIERFGGHADACCVCNPSKRHMAS